MATTKQASKTDTRKVKLPLVPGRKEERLSFWGGAHLLITLSMHLFIFLPIRTFASFFLLRLVPGTSAHKANRPLLADAVSKTVQFFYSRCSVPQARLFFNSSSSYTFAHALSPTLRGRGEMISTVEADGIKGRWINKPGGGKKPDVVLYFVHGGAFTTDNGAAAQELLLKTIDAVKEKQGLSAAAFSLDYHLAPEYKYPTQLIEVAAGYHYLANELDIPTDRIVLVGDSAGGNLVSSFLLHLARPSKDISLPDELGETPGKPGAVLLISPEVKFASLSKSTYTNIPFDVTSMGFIFRGAADYIGARLPFSHRFRTRWVLNPLWHLVDPQRLPPVPAEKLADYEGWVGWNKVENVELFKSPYVQPGVCTDESWWKEALPGDSKTIVAWGGLEVLKDDVEAFYAQLEKAGVQPRKLYKELGVHSWPVFDYAIPQLWKTKSTSPDPAYDYGLKAIVSLLQQVAASSSSKSAKPTSDTPTATSTAVPEPLAGSNSEAAKRAKAVHAFRQPSEPELPVKGKSFADAAARDEYIADDAPVVVKGEGKTLEAHLEDGKLVAERKLLGSEEKKEPGLPPIPKAKPTSDPFPSRKEEKKAEPQVKITKPKPVNKPVPPVPAPEEGGSYAAAASSKGLAEDAVVVAKGEGDALKPSLTDGHVGAEVAQTKAETAAKSAPGTGGSWAKMAAASVEDGEGLPIVAEGEGATLKATLEDGSLHATSA